MNIFVYRELNNRGDRDACCYTDTRGGASVYGACFSHIAGTGFDGVYYDYDEVETALTRTQYNDMCAYGITDEILNALQTPEALQFADEILEDEAEILMDRYNLSRSDLDEIFDYTNYRDNGAVADITDIDGVVDEMKHIVEDSLNIPEQWKKYFDYEAMAEDAISEDEEYTQLSNGRIAILNV